jgi:hypothetical protein
MLHIFAEENFATGQRRRTQQHAIPPAKAMLIRNRPSELSGGEIVGRRAKFAQRPDEAPYINDRRDAASYRENVVAFV